MADIPPSPLALPWDALYEIACYIVDDNQTRLAFMNVNKLWRDVITNTPSFWTEISVCSSFSTSVTMQHALERIEWLTGRSHSLPLHVTLNLKRYDDKNKQELAKAFIHRAPPECWQTLIITDNDWIPHPAALSALFADHQFTSLRSLVFQWSFASKMVGFIQIIEDTAPILSSITVSYGLSHRNRPDRPLPLRLIGPQTEVRFPHHGLRLDNASVVALLPKVEKLFLVNEPDVTDTQLQSNAFSALTKLTMINSHGSCLSKLHLPNLEELSIETCRRSGTDLSLPKLRILRLWKASLDLLPCLEAPLLEELHLKGSSLVLDSALDDPRYQLSPNKLTINGEISPTDIFLLLSLSPRINHLNITVRSRTRIMERILELLSMKNRPEEEKYVKYWRLGGELCHLYISLNWVKLISDTTRLEEPARKLFSERSKGCLESICIEWTDGSVFRLGVTNGH